MHNLIIGNTSQLFHFFPKNYKNISSRNIDWTSHKTQKYNYVFILFAEQRTFLNETEDFFKKINVDYTLKVIDFFKEISNNVVVYSTSELWNNYEGMISLNHAFNYNYTPYIKSKEILCNFINENKQKYKNVNIIYPFNFNSPFRKDGFLFSKIFASLINKSHIEIGNINFYRDIVHPNIIVKESIQTKTDKLIGTGELINIEKFVIDLYNSLNLNFNDYVNINDKNNLPNTRKNYYSAKKYSTYNELLTLTKIDANNKISKRYDQ